MQFHRLAKKNGLINHVLGLLFLCPGHFAKISTKHPLAYTLTTPDLLKWCNRDRHGLKIRLLFPTVLHCDRPVTRKYVLCAHKTLQPSLEDDLWSPTPLICPATMQLCSGPQARHSISEFSHCLTCPALSS